LAFFCDVFPSTRGLEGYRSEKRRRRTIGVVMDGT
jgi:hypothetical protein